MSEDLTAILAAIRERNEHLRSRYGYVGGLLALAGSKDDVSHLLAAVEAVLELADGWLDFPALVFLQEDCAHQVREAITAALARTGKEGGDE